jgi:SPP1 gp7 family putative phage head morphogenesis protein
MPPLFMANASDPTRTLTLRNRFIADMDRRFKSLMRDITTTIVENDALGLKEPEVRTLEAAPPKAFAYTRDAEKIPAFMAWLNEQEQQGILEITNTSYAPGGEPWTNTYIRTSYQRGMESARSKLISAGTPLLPFDRQLNGLVQAFNRPFHANRVALIYTRAFSELKGITNAMDQQISRVLAEGLSQGWGVQEMARKINDRVQKIGISRARTLARTETVRAFNEAAIMEYKSAEGIIGEPIFDKWFTAADERVRSTHAVRHNKVFTHEQALSLIGEPNCRCTLVPFIESIHGAISAKDKQSAKTLAKGGR